MISQAVWMLLTVGVAHAPVPAAAEAPAPVAAEASAAAEAPAPVAPAAAQAPVAAAPVVAAPAVTKAQALPTLGVPGLVLVGGSEDDRLLHGEQLAAALEGAGFTVRDATALTAMGARVPQGGCASSAAPLCGDADGIDLVVLGRVVRATDGASWVELQLVKAGSRQQLWRGSFTAANDAELAQGFSTVALEHLPPVARKSQIPEPQRSLGLTRQEWGASAFLAGTALAVASGTVFALAERKRIHLTDLGDTTQPLFPRDALRSQQEVPLMRGLATTAAVLSAAGLVGGFLLWNSAPAPVVSLSLSPTGDAGAVVFSGVLP